MKKITMNPTLRLALQAEALKLFFLRLNVTRDSEGKIPIELNEEELTYELNENTEGQSVVFYFRGENIIRIYPQVVGDNMLTVLKYQKSKDFHIQVIEFLNRKDFLLRYLNLPFNEEKLLLGLKRLIKL